MDMVCSESQKPQILGIWTPCYKSFKQTHAYGARHRNHTYSHIYIVYKDIHIYIYTHPYHNTYRHKYACIVDRQIDRQIDR